MPDYTPSDLPRLMVGRVKRIRVPNPFRHNTANDSYCIHGIALGAPTLPESQKW
jgi:hypothetical protein